MTNLNFEHHLGSLTHAALSQASIISRVWGEGPSERYDELASNFRPTFARIKEGALIREQQHILPYEQLQWLKDIGFTRLRLPKTHGALMQPFLNYLHYSLNLQRPTQTYRKLCVCILVSLKMSW